MSEADLKEIGKRIQQRRKQQGLTQEQLAEMMNVSIQMISNLERGNKSIRIENLIRLCQLLDVSTDYILTGKTSASDFSETVKQIVHLPDKEKNLINLIINYFISE